LDGSADRWKDGAILTNGGAMAETTTSGRTPVGRTSIGPVLAIAGGVLLVIGSFLSWAEISGGGQSQSVSGTDVTDGWVTLVAGLVAIAAGVAALRAPRRPLAVAAGIAGGFGVGFGLFDALTLKDSALDSVAEETAAASGVSFQELRTLLDVLIDNGQLGISIGIGLYVVIAGGVLAMVGAALQLARDGSTTPAVDMPTAVAAGEPGPSV
jgi:hypothetical protein